MRVRTAAPLLAGLTFAACSVLTTAERRSPAAGGDRDCDHLLARATSHLTTPADTTGGAAAAHHAHAAGMHEYHRCLAEKSDEVTLSPE
jgi:hypothetical protein